MASGQQLTEKCGTKSAVWKYFSLIVDYSGGGSQQDNPVCQIGGVQVRAATGNTSNLLSHLKNLPYHTKNWYGSWAPSMVAT